MSGLADACNDNLAFAITDGFHRPQEAVIQPRDKRFDSRRLALQALGSTINNGLLYHIISNLHYRLFCGLILRPAQYIF